MVFGMSNQNDVSGSNSSARRVRVPASTRTFVAGMAAGVVLVLALLLVVGLPLSLAHHTELPLEGAVGHWAVNIISSLNAGNAGNPLVSNDKSLADGEDLYNSNCASCHGDHGDGKGDFVNVYFPPPADLTSDNTQGKSDAQLRWIVQHGLSFTAMAAYPDFDDPQVWSIIIYMRSLKK
jgi:hypothetical protein